MTFKAAAISLFLSTKIRGGWLIAACLAALLAGCSGYDAGGGRFVSKWHGFEIQAPPEEFWRRTPDVANILALNDPSTSVLYYDNPYTGGVISLQMVPRHYPGQGKVADELQYIYRRMLGTPHVNMRTILNGRFLPFERAVRFGQVGGSERAEFFLKGSMGRRPTIEAREFTRLELDRKQPFGGPRTKEEIKAERLYQSSSLSPNYMASYHGKVVVFMKNAKLYEFYYIDHEDAFKDGLPVFDSFVKSMKFIPGGIF